MVRGSGRPVMLMASPDYRAFEDEPAAILPSGPSLPSAGFRYPAERCWRGRRVGVAGSAKLTCVDPPCLAMPTHLRRLQSVSERRFGEPLPPLRGCRFTPRTASDSGTSEFDHADGQVRLLAGGRRLARLPRRVPRLLDAGGNP